jgi:hypothetical protein
MRWCSRRMGRSLPRSGEDGTTRIWALAGQNSQQIAQYEGYGTLRDDWQYIAVSLATRPFAREWRG